MPTQRDVIAAQNKTNTGLLKDIKSLNDQLEAANANVVLLKEREGDQIATVARMRYYADKHRDHINKLENLLAIYLEEDR